MDEANKELDVPLVNCDIAMEMMKMLPPLSQACQLGETFLEFGKFLSVSVPRVSFAFRTDYHRRWYPLPRKYIFDDIISVIYHSPK